MSTKPNRQLLPSTIGQDINCLLYFECDETYAIVEKAKTSKAIGPDSTKTYLKPCKFIGELILENTKLFLETREK